MDAPAEQTADTDETGSEETETNADAYLHKMQVLEYDMLYGDHATTGGVNPYEPTKLQMGVLPIELRSATASGDGKLYVGGSNFTAFSVVYDGDEALPTEYHSPWLLSADISGKEVGDRLVVTVAQYAQSDHVILSQTDSISVFVTEQEKIRDNTSGQSEDPFYQEEESETQAE